MQQINDLHIVQGGKRAAGGNEVWFGLKVWSGVTTCTKNLTNALNASCGAQGQLQSS